MPTDDQEPTTPGSGRFASLAVRDFRRLWWGGVFVFLGMQTQQIARSWLAYELTGTNTALGGVLIGFGIASLIAIPVGGVLADRISKRSILVGSQVVNLVVALALAVAIETDVIAYWMIVAASVLGGMSISVLAPARLAMTAEVVDRDHLTNAIMLGSMSAQATRVVGPAVGGAMIGIAWIGVEGVYYLSAVLSAVAVVLSMVLPPGVSRRVARGGPLDDLADGLRYTRDRPEVVRLLTTSLLVVMFGFAYVAFLPAVVADLYGRGAGGLGALGTSSAIGAVAMSVFLADTPRERLAAYQSHAAYALGGSLLVFALMPTFAAALIAIFFVGGMAGAFQSLNSSLVLSSVDMEYHGRVQSLIMLSWSAFGLAALPFGMIADAVGLRETMVGMAVAVLASSLYSQRWRARIVARTATAPLEALWPGSRS